MGRLDTVLESEDEALPLPTPLSCVNSSYSSPSLKPRPLNFSRPLRLRTDSSDVSTHSSEATRTSLDWSNDDDDGAAAPPIVRTHANRNSLDLETLSISDSIDDAIPPPIKTGSRTIGAAYYSNKWADQGPSQEDADDPKPWGRVPDGMPHRPPSVASTAETDMTCTTFDEEDEDEDAESIAGSEATTQSAATAHSSVTSFMFDGQMGVAPRQPSLLVETQSQRWMPQRPGMREGSAPQSETTQVSNSVDSSAGSAQPLLKTQTRLSTASSSTSASTSSAPPPPIPPRKPRIVKRTSVDQRSEHVNPWQGENMSDRGSISSNEWSSSDHDTSVLSVEKIHKLKKKGINPALYIEMKNARKGNSKWINPLGGSSFLS